MKKEEYIEIPIIGEIDSRSGKITFYKNKEQVKAKRQNQLKL